MLAQRYGRIIRDWDPRLDDPVFIEQALYAAAGLSKPAKPKLRWHFEHLDLCIFDETTQTIFILHQGPN